MMSKRHILQSLSSCNFFLKAKIEYISNNKNISYSISYIKEEHKSRAKYCIKFLKHM
ncbi:hypothetical protein MtrunA17_Chr1g0200361 [Medicago truncatula]|uniref:Uncharacterized protein n=1 Tax=Medicago truncatula TaxID=3880 RepID=A0A396K684_MEDTR|nr:hypothetical protein MtrunA17_Chr1g0200361 [Medicago truncatula]